MKNNKSSNKSTLETINEYEKNKKVAESLIDKAFPEQVGRPKIWKDIHNGYTNYSFMVTLEDSSIYQVRLPHDGKIIDRKNEYDVLFNYLYSNDFVYYDPKTGNAIKKWIYGSCPTRRIYKKEWFINILFSQIKKLHELQLKPDHKFDEIDFGAYTENLYRLKFHYQKKFLCLIDRRRFDAKVFNHTDINPLNMIYNKESNSIRLIDFEWAGLASDYFDYANFVRETGINYKNINFLKYIKHFDMEIFEQYLYLISVYAYLWTFAMPQSKKIIKYRYKTLRQIRKYYLAVINVDKSCYVTENAKNKKKK